MAKQVSMNRIRSDMKKLNTDSFYVGTYETLALLLQDFPEWKGGKKPPVGGKICDYNSWAYVGKDSTYDTYKFNEKGKWKKISDGGGSSPLQPDQQALIDAWSENDILYIGNNPETPQELDWQIIKKGVYLYSYQWVEGKWKEYSKIGGSTQIDTLILKGLRASIFEVNDAGEKFNIWRGGSTPRSNIFGSSQRRVFILADGRDRVDIAYSGSPVAFEPSPLGTDKLSEVEMNFEFDYSRDTDTEVMYATHNLYKPTKARFSVMDITESEDKGRLIYESKNLKEFRLDGGDLVVGIDGATTGAVKLLLNDRIFFIVGRKYRLTAQCLTTNDCGFEGVNRFPWVKMEGHESLASMVATEEWINEQPFTRPQTLQQTLVAGNTMDVNTNINLIGLNVHTQFDISKTTHKFNNTGDITFDSNGYLFSSLNLITVTPPEATNLEINLNPTTPTIAPRLITYQITDVPDKPIDYQQNISFRVTETDGKTTTVPYKYVVDTKSTPMNGIFLIELDGREIKNIAMVITKFSRGATPSFPNYGYMKIIKMYDGEYTKLFDNLDGRIIINPNLIVGSQPQLVTWDSILNKPEILPDAVDNKKYVRTKGSWVESVATDVTWDNISGKPTDLLTETLLTTNQHSGIPTTSNGKGLYSKQSIDAQAERNIARYNEKDGSIEIGDINEALRLNYSYLWGYRNIGGDSYLIQEIDTDTLLGKAFTTELIIQEDGTKVTDLAISIKQDCLVTISFNDIIMAENKPCTVGRFMIPIPMYELHNGGAKIKVDIQSSVADSIGGLLLPTPSPFIGYIGTMFTEGQILSDADSVNRLELNSKGAIVKKNRLTNTDSKLISFEKNGTIFGSHDQRAIVASSRPIGTSIIEDSQGVVSTEIETKIIGSQFTFSVPNTFIDGYFLDSITLSINKNTRIECEIDGNAVMGDGHLFRKVGEHTLKSSYRAPIGKTINVSILTKDAVDCLIGAYNEETKVYTPKVTINLIKIKNSEICTKDVARNIEVQNGDNLIVQANLTGLQIPYALDWLGFEVPEGRQMPSIVSRDFNEQYILIENDFEIKENEKFIIAIPDMIPLHSKSRVSFNLNVHQKNGYINLVKINPKTITIKARSGEELRPEFNYNLLEGQPQINIIVDFNVVDDVFIIEFGDGNVFSGSETTLTIWETTSSIQSPFQQPMFDERGRIHKSLMSSEYASSEQLREVSIEGRNINVFNNDTIYINTKQESRKYDSPRLISQSENFIRYAVSDAVLYDLPTIVTYQNKFSTLYGAKSNITAGGFINTRIMDMGGNYSIPQDKKAIITYYLYNTVTAPVLNANTIKLFDSSDVIIPSTITINTSETNATIEFMVEKLSNTIIVNFGEGNNLSGCNVLIDVSTIREDIIGTPMIDEFGKINKELYSGWDKKLDLTKENIDITIPDNSVYANADMSIAGTRSKGITPITEMKTENGLTFVDYGSNCILDEDGKWVDFNLTIPESYVGALCDVEYKIDYKETIPTIVLDDFTVYSKPEIKKTLRDEGLSKIITFKDVLLEDVIRLRTLTTNATGLIKTNLSNCTTSSVKFINIGATKVVPMFINNKINESISSGWDMKVDLPTENITISKSSPIEYNVFHTIPFARRDDWTPNEYTIFETQIPAVNLNQCTHFTIKGVNPPPNFTDISVKYQLIVEDENGVRVTTDCVACTEMKDSIYNKLKSPIPSTCRITLLVNSLQDPFGFLPSDEYNIDFCTSSSGIVNVPLFNDGLLNEEMMPKNAGFNEIELYPVSNPLDPKNPINPSIVYSSGACGNINLISGSYSKSTETNISNYFSDLNVYTTAKDGVNVKFLGEQFNIVLANASEPTPLDGSVWKTLFENTSLNDALIGLETYAKGKIKLNIKITKTLDNTILVNRDFEVEGSANNPSEIYIMFTQTELNLVKIGTGEHEIIVTKISDTGTLYGANFPISRLHLSTVSTNHLITKEVIEEQVKCQTSKAYFLTNPAQIGIISELDEKLKQELQTTVITIPVQNHYSNTLIGIAPNVFSSDRFTGQTIVIEANFSNVHPSNFRNSEGVQCCKLICSPNNPSYLYLTGLGYTIDCGGEVPNPNTPNAHLITDENGVMGWATTSNNVGDVYLSSTMRIKAVGTDFLFETLISENWVQVGKMGL